VTSNNESTIKPVMHPGMFVQQIRQTLTAKGWQASVISAPILGGGHADAQKGILPMGGERVPSKDQH